MIGCLRRWAGPQLPRRGPPPPPKKKIPLQSKKPQSPASIPEHLRRFRPFLPPQLVSETTSFLGNSSNVRRLLDVVFGSAREDQGPRDEAGMEASRVGGEAGKGCSLEEAEDFQERLEEYQLRRAEYLAPFVEREAAAAKTCWQAISALPRDLFEEATRSNYCAFPDPPSSTDGSVQNEWTSGRKTMVIAETANSSTPAAVAFDADTLGWEFQAFPIELAFHAMYRTHFMNAGGLNAEERRRLQVFMNLMYLRFPHAEHKETKPHLFWTSERAAISREKERALASKKK